MVSLWMCDNVFAKPGGIKTVVLAKLSMIKANADYLSS